MGRGWVPLGTALISEALPQYVVDRDGVNAIRREPGVEVAPYSDLSHTARPSTHSDNANADQIRISGEGLGATHL